MAYPFTLLPYRDRKLCVGGGGGGGGGGGRYAAVGSYTLITNMIVEEN